MVNTGVWKNSGTTANIYIEIHGSEATSSPIMLHRNIAKRRVILARGSSDKLYINLKQSLGTLKRLEVWHDNSGLHPSWFLSSVIIRDVKEHEITLFLCNRWFAVGKDDGKIARSVYPISRKKMNSFKTKFESLVSENFADNHLWLSVITKAPKSTFTRVQRATCCLTFLLSAMIANAMFYRLDETPDQRIHVGPLRFSPRQVSVGVQTCLIVAPINLFIVWLFRNSEPMRNKEEIGGGKHRKDVEDHIDGEESKYIKISSNKERSLPSIDSKNNKHTKWNTSFEEINEHIIPRFEETTENYNLSNKRDSKDSFVLSSESKSSVFDALHLTSLEKAIEDEYFEEEDYPNYDDEDISEEESQRFHKLYWRKRKRRSKPILEHELRKLFDSRNLFDIDSKGNDKDENFKTADEDGCRERGSIETDSDCYTPRSVNAKKINATDVRNIEDIDLQIQKDSVLSGSVAREHKKKESTCKLSYWCQNFAWFLCFVVIVTSASFTLFYSLMWGKEVASQWLSSMFVSFVQELFLNQPIKMFILMIIFAWILKKPADEMTRWDDKGNDSLCSLSFPL